MKKFLVIALGVLAMITPCVITILLLWVLLYKPHRSAVLLMIKNWKGDLEMLLNRITGRQSHFDEKLGEKEDLSNLDVDRKFGQYMAEKYLTYKQKHQTQVAGANSLIVLAFGVGCIVIGAIWFVMTNVIPKLY